MSERPRPRTRPGSGGARRGDRRPAPGGGETMALWLFGLHAVRDALANPRRLKKRLLLTPNALGRLGEAVAAGGVEPELQDPRRFQAPLDPQSVHQGAALETEPLDWGDLEALCAPRDSDATRPLTLLLDRVTDPHNVGAVLRSAEVFGARAVIAPRRHSAPETGALAKAASGALERQPYLRVQNLARAIEALRGLGYQAIGLDGEAEGEVADAVRRVGAAPIALVLGAEGDGLRQLTRDSCDALARIPAAGGFGSLNVSNAAAVALYAARIAAA